MADHGCELRRIVWSEAFPFVRLFHTLRLALGFTRLVLALAALVCLYVGGRVLDAVWGEGGGVVAMPRDGGIVTEIEVYATSPHAMFKTWAQEARDAHAERAVNAALQAGLAVSRSDAKRLLANAKLRDLMLDDAFRGELRRLRELVDQLERNGLTTLTGDTSLSREDRDRRRQELAEAADTVRQMLAGKPGRGPTAAAAGAKAIETLTAAGPTGDRAQRAQHQADLTKATARQAQLQQYEDLTPRGPFIRLLQYEQQCFGAAIRGVCTGRFGWSGRAFDAEPAMAGSIDSAVRGVCWLVNQKPGFALLLAAMNLLIFAFFGGAICRSAAVQVTRDESLGLGATLRFACQRYGGFLLAPVLPVGLMALIAVVMFVGGLIGTIGYVGELFTGVFYFLALLGGFAAALAVLALVLGFHLMWPTIAVEGSDGFDALARACNYVATRIWHTLFYAAVLLVYGALSFILVRLVVLLTLKLAHGFTGWGLNLISSSGLTSVGKLDAMWRMPAWSDLSLLPGGDVRLNGTYFNGPLDGTEWLGALGLLIWGYLMVGLLGAFVISYFFCGSTQAYLLLRRHVDATDFDEVYYEEPAEEPPLTATEPSATPATTESPAAPPTTEAPPAQPSGGEAPPSP